MKDSSIRPREREAVINSLRAGVVPRQGQHLIQVGRVAELRAVLADVTLIANGGSSFKLVIGAYGSGKSFFLQLARSVAMEKKLVTMQCDLNPDRRLHATAGQARSLYTELTRNMATRSCPDGGAMSAIVERFVSKSMEEGEAQGIAVELIINHKLHALCEMVNGYDFANVISQYWEGFKNNDSTTKGNVIRWLRGEFSTKTEARQLLGVRNIVDDTNYYDQLKLLSRFVRMSGYEGLLICLDELVNIYKLHNVKARQSNYEQLLRILNDSLQGSSTGLGFILGGTPEFLFDDRRGAHSYEALKSRLSDNEFAREDLLDLTGPVLKLPNLSPEDLYLMLQKVRNIYSNVEDLNILLPDDAIVHFLTHCSRRLGNDYYRTPRNTITSFINFLAVIEQNREKSWIEIIGSHAISVDNEAELDLLNTEGDDELTTIRL
ncbi:MAG: ATP-binding protein [Gammaproteobacteria bacterium]|nr:MAG: ATP-binding protein [Gammaproteobacteria bacterium]